MPNNTSVDNHSKVLQHNTDMKVFEVAIKDRSF